MLEKPEMNFVETTCSASLTYIESCDQDGEEWIHSPAHSILLSNLAVCDAMLKDTPLSGLLIPSNQGLIAKLEQVLAQVKIWRQEGA